MKTGPMMLLFVGIFVGAGLMRLENRHQIAIELQRGQINQCAKSNPPAIAAP